MWRLDNPLGCDRDVVRPAHPGTPEPLRECPAPKRTLRRRVCDLLVEAIIKDLFRLRLSMLVSMLALETRISCVQP